MAVFVLDKHKKPLMPCSEKRARLLLTRKRAVIFLRYPFTIRLKDRISGALQSIRIKLDPGSKITGIALVREKFKQQIVLFLAHLKHRSLSIRDALYKRSCLRRRRRFHLRYRPKRFNNRTRISGWLAPSLKHRVDTTFALVNKLRKLSPINHISMELNKFDPQKLQNNDIAGIEYQRGELFGFEIKEYLLEKWARKCAYCSANNVPLEIDHIVPRSKGGSNRVSNLIITCRPCNQKKNNQPLESFLKKDAQKLRSILSQAKKPLKDAAAINSTRFALLKSLKHQGFQVEVATGGKTKWNRTRLKIPKDHALDAACVGEVIALENWQKPILEITAMGRGTYARTRLDRFGFPRGYLLRKKQVFGFQTGDIVKASVMKGKKAGKYTGRIAIRASGNFNLRAQNQIIQGISHRYCRLVQRADGYHYSLLNINQDQDGPHVVVPAIPPSTKVDGILAELS